MAQSPHVWAFMRSEQTWVLIGNHLLLSKGILTLSQSAITGIEICSKLSPTIYPFTFSIEWYWYGDFANLMMTSIPVTPFHEEDACAHHEGSIFLKMC